MTHDVFISYSSKDKNVVDEICNLFSIYSITYWRDTNEVHMGGKFMEDIVDAINASSIVLFISSVDSNHSIYTAKEVAFAFNAGKYIIPYKIDDSSFSKNLQFVMTDLNCINATPYSQQKAELLIHDILSLLRGERHKEMHKTHKREYIDVEKWDEPGNRIWRCLRKIFQDK